MLRCVKIVVFLLWFLVLIPNGSFIWAEIFTSSDRKLAVWINQQDLHPRFLHFKTWSDLPQRIFKRKSVWRSSLFCSFSCLVPSLCGLLLWIKLLWPQSLRCKPTRGLSFPQPWLASDFIEVEGGFKFHKYSKNLKDVKKFQMFYSEFMMIEMQKIARHHKRTAFAKSTYSICLHREALHQAGWSLFKILHKMFVSIPFGVDCFN